MIGCVFIVISRLLYIMLDTDKSKLLRATECGEVGTIVYVK